MMKTQGGVGLAQALRAQQGEEALLVRQSLSGGGWQPRIGVAPSQGVSDCTRVRRATQWRGSLMASVRPQSTHTGEGWVAEMGTGLPTGR